MHIIYSVLDHHKIGGSSSSSHHHHHNNNDHKEPHPPCNINVAFEGMSLALECIQVVLNSFDMNRVRTMLLQWIKVDDVYFCAIECARRAQRSGRV